MKSSPNILLARLLTRSRLRQWQLVQEIATFGSVQRASEAVGMSQPAATHALTDIEALLGVALFERHAKGARLTLAGAAVLPRVRQALQAIAECADIVSAMHSGSSGVVRLGATGAGVSGLLSQALPAFSERFPYVVIHVRELAPHALVRGLLESTLDAAVCRPLEPMLAETAFFPILHDRYVVVCSPRHPLAAKQGVTLDELATQRWLLPPSSTIAERDFHAMWGARQMPEDLCRVESRLALVMWSMVERRQALAFIPYNTTRQWLDSGTLAQIPGTWGPPLTDVGVMVRSERLQGRSPLTDFLDEVRRWADDLQP